MHGAGGGAPQGNRNAHKHGHYSAAAMAERRSVARLLREARDLLAGLE
jgi:glucans biosynthesis protein